MRYKPYQTNRERIHFLGGNQNAEIKRNDSAIPRVKTWSIYYICSKIVNAMGCFVFPLLALILTDKIGLSKSETGKLMSLFGVLFIPASMIGGKLCDVIGRKKIILILWFYGYRVICNMWFLLNHQWN